VQKDTKTQQRLQFVQIKAESHQIDSLSSKLTKVKKIKETDYGIQLITDPEFGIFKFYFFKIKFQII
ncbi:unnamed protein product, partial [Hymenolepis diminuta]